ncbi:MAG: hypothetical protein P1U53_08695 [Sulfitobacter sp.]|nr:hypothetical protein [Sulfitobacter sp.]
MRKTIPIVLCVAVVLAVASGVFFAVREGGDQRFAVAGGGELSAEEFSDKSFLLVPDMLAVIYRAFAETEESQIYDSLAEVSADAALETLYLERVGAMAGGGLETADQELHAMELEALSSRRTGNSLRMNVSWRVVGTVGHATHLHVRGNTYAADMVLEPVEGAWRITDFDLTDVDRSDAGVMVASE